MKQKILALLCVLALGIPMAAMATGCDNGNTNDSSTSNEQQSSISDDLSSDSSDSSEDIEDSVVSDSSDNSEDIVDSAVSDSSDNSEDVEDSSVSDSSDNSEDVVDSAVSDSSNGSEDIVDSSVSDSSDSTIEATKYTVKFIDENGNILSESEIEEGEMPVAPATSTPQNTAEYTYTGAWDKEIETVTGDATYTWVVIVTKNKYEVTFDGGNATEYGYGSVVTATQPTKEGFIFEGWSVNGEKVDITTYQITGETAFVSVWKEGFDFAADMREASVDGDESATVVQSDDVFVGGISYMIATKDSNVTINLPKINYGNYSEINFDIQCSTFCFIGPSVNMRAYSTEGDYITGTVKIVPTAAYLAVIMTVDGKEYAVYETNESVINGTAPLTFSAQALAGNRYFNVSAFTVSHEPTDYVGPAIGIINGALTTCGYETSSLIEGGYKYDLGNGGRKGEWTVLLTSVDYSQYKSVTYQYEGSAGWMTIGFWRDGAKGDAIAGASLIIKGTITVTNNDGVYTVTINDTATGKSVSMELTDTQIINGEKAFGIYVDNGAAYRQFNIGKPVCSNE